MTRFARAKGSKASNERVPEEATSWADMKAQMQEKKEQAEFDKGRKQAEAVRKENYNNFLEECENEKLGNSQWAEFEDTSNTENKKKQKNKKRKGDDDTTEQDACKKVKTDDESGPSDMKLKKKKKNKLENVNDNEEINSEEVSVANKKKKKGKLVECENKNEDCDNNQQKKKKKNKQLTEEQTENNDLSPKKNKKLNQNLGENNESLNSSVNADTPKKNEANAETNNKGKFENRNNFNKGNNKFGKNDRNNKEKQRRKPNSFQESMNINGVEVAIGYFDGFPIKKEDCDRLHELRKQMISKGLPRSEVKRALQLERRRAEKALAREKKKVCFNCRKSGHVLSECPNLNKGNGHDMIASGICFKCGSTEHTHFECKVVKNQQYKFATCFICKEQGHISNQCPDNPRGVYPKGGACKLCGDVTHLKKDCPRYQAEQEESNIFLDKIDDNVESLERQNTAVAPQKVQKNKVVKF